MEIFSSFKQRRPGYLWWWTIYQAAFIFASAFIVVLFIRLNDERFGIISYIKNYFVKVLVSLFIAVFLIFVLLLIYFVVSVLSLQKYLQKENKKRATNVLSESRINLTADPKPSTSGSVQMIPVTIPDMTEANGDATVGTGSRKFYIVYV